MPYRPLSRRALKSGNGNHHRASRAARIAVARSTARKKRPPGPNAVLVLLLILLVSGVSVASAAVITAGGAATMALSALDQGLPDVKAFRDLDFNEQSTMFARDGKTRLAQFWDDRRSVIEDFDNIPKVVLDATTATEDKTFWNNPGVDLQATIAQVLATAGGGEARGASTITQQLVRAVLLPEDVLANQTTTEGIYERKVKEIIQSFKLTQAFPGETGKQEIIKAYLNQIPYGGAVHGIKAAASAYLGKSIGQLTLAEAAFLAAIPQEPGNLYPYKTNPKNGKYVNIVREKYGKKNKKTGKQKTRYVVRQCGDKPDCTDTDVVKRQQFILNRLRDGYGRWTLPTAEQVEAAKAQKIVIQPQKAVKYKAPQFVNKALVEVQQILGNDYDPVKVGGYKIVTTLDWNAQKLGQDLIWAGAIAPHLPTSQMYSGLRKRGLAGESSWVTRLRALGVYSGALIAMDYRTGDVLAYVASPDYYRKSRTPKLDPQMDHVGIAKRQPGSSWKPIVYASGIDTGRLTAASVLLDITTPFGAGWVPKNATPSDQGPILVRDALQQSLNVPAIRALDRTGIKTVRKYAVKAGYEFLPDFGNRALDVAGLAGAIGTVEVRPLDHAKAFGAFGNNGKVTEPRYILSITGPKGEKVYRAGKPVSKQVWSPQTAYIITDILAGNTNIAENPDWGRIFQLNNTKNGARREAAVKTGTTNNLKDYSTYGYLPRPDNNKQPALVVGVWYGNSDSSAPNVTNPPVYSLDNAGQTWHAFVQRYMQGKPAPTFKPPKAGVVTATVRVPNGGSRTENFIRGTQPGGPNQIDPLYSCSGGITSLENPGAPSSWLAADNAWASRGVGGVSQWGTPKTRSGGCGGGSSSSGSSDSSSGSSGGGNSGGGNSGGGGGGGPAPTCQPGFTDKPTGCVIPG